MPRDKAEIIRRERFFGFGLVHNLNTETVIRIRETALMVVAQ
jgi:hypothetical protein